MSPLSPAETLEAQGCRVTLRRWKGPVAQEFYLHAAPVSANPDVGGQARALYRAVGEALATAGTGFDAISSEFCFLRHTSDAEAVRAARAQVVGAAKGDPTPPTLEVRQPPLQADAPLELSLQAWVPTEPARFESFAVRDEAPARPPAPGQRITLGEERRFTAHGIVGSGADAYAQTRAMFRASDRLLADAGFGFEDVARTWIHLREMERDYDAFNRARRDFFAERSIDPPPASTGIGGAPVPEHHDLCLGLTAIATSGPGAPERTVMTTPTLNEAPVYGSDFVRGLRVAEANKVALYVSGTASIDEAGQTVHAGDLEAQVERMLLNVATLLERQDAGFGDIASAITYLKHPADAERLRAQLRAAGFDGFPHALVAATVCRPDLLCETEVLALRPAPASTT